VAQEAARLKKPDNLIFECVSGSHAYGLNHASSDEDVRGVFMISPYESTVDGLYGKPIEQVSDEKSDIVYYELKRFMNLLGTNNPTVVELLFMPADCVKQRSAEMDVLTENRSIFVTKRARFSFGEYARAQLHTAKGHNKMFSNPYPAEKPTRESMCYIISTDLSKDDTGMPMRPVPLSEAGVDLSEYHAAACERLANAFRLYHYGKGAKGVFRGDGPVFCESIPIDDERKRYRYLMLFDEARYEATVKKWKQYWDWVKSRNASKWTNEDGSPRDYDSKKLSHCLRLLMSAINIAENGAPIVRFAGSQRDFLMEVKSAKHGYGQIVDFADDLFVKMEKAYDSCKLPEDVDFEKAKRLYFDIRTGRLPFSSPCNG